MARRRIFSGIQPTGILHLGNYLGALRNWGALQDKWDCIYCIVDYHAITVPYEPGEMQACILNVASGVIAAGMDPERCTLFVQSRVPEHTELTWILNSLVGIGQLERMTQFKDKSGQHREAVNAGLLDYPVLQAADILLYKAEAVPVGEDQAQHLELSRDVARKFNNRFGDTFPEPKTLLSSSPRIMGLNGQSKMSKTKGNYIALTDPPEEVWKKLAPAVTDPARKRRPDPGNPLVCNIYSLHTHFSTKEQRDWVREGCTKATIGCLDCKKVLADNINEVLAPIRERHAELEAKPEIVRRALEEGARRCRRIARRTMKEVKSKMGLL